jgi:hypothetical protein
MFASLTPARPQALLRLSRSVATLLIACSPLAVETTALRGCAAILLSLAGIGCDQHSSYASVSDRSIGCALRRSLFALNLRCYRNSVYRLMRYWSYLKKGTTKYVPNPTMGHGAKRSAQSSQCPLRQRRIAAQESAEGA